VEIVEKQKRGRKLKIKEEISKPAPQEPQLVEVQKEGI
jgi:hypothetical protein